MKRRCDGRWSRDEKKKRKKRRKGKKPWLDRGSIYRSEERGRAKREGKKKKPRLNFEQFRAARWSYDLERAINVHDVYVQSWPRELDPFHSPNTCPRKLQRRYSAWTRPTDVTMLDFRFAFTVLRLTARSSFASGTFQSVFNFTVCNGPCWTSLVQPRVIIFTCRDCEFTSRSKNVDSSSMETVEILMPVLLEVELV